MSNVHYFVPNYVQENRKENGMIIKNLANNAEIELSDEELDDYYCLKKYGATDIQSEMAQILIQEDFLVTADRQAELYKLCLDQLSRTLFVVIMPTEACNFRCIYCYETHDPVTMSRTTISGVKNFISDLLKDHTFDDLQISWFGGEPTLCTEIMEDVMKFAHDTVVHLSPNTKVHSTITTNGYNLDNQTFIRLLEVGIDSYQITLDGFLHDQKRFLKNGGKTLNRIVDNLLSIHQLDLSYQFEILLRNNILAGDSDFNWYDYLHSLFGNDPRFSYSVIPVVKLGGKHDNMFEVEDDDILVNKHLAYLHQLGMNVTPRLTDGPLSGVCFAAYPYGYVIRADGSIGKCTIELYDPMCTIGKITGAGVFIDHEKEAFWIDESFDEKCCSCKDGLICMNRACPIKRMHSGDKHFCIQR